MKTWCLLNTAGTAVFSMAFRKIIAPISSSPSCLTPPTSRRHGSQQGEGQLRGDFNLSENIHIQPLMPPFTIQPLRLLRLPCSLPGTHHSSFPVLPSSSCHLIQITELASFSFVCGFHFAWQMDRRRGDGLTARGVLSACVRGCVLARWKE